MMNKIILYLLLSLTISCELLEDNENDKDDLSQSSSGVYESSSSLDAVDMTLDPSVVLSYEIHDERRSDSYVSFEAVTKYLVGDEFPDVRFEDLDNPSCDYKAIFLSIGNDLHYASLKYDSINNKWILYRIRPEPEKSCIEVDVIVSHKFLVCDPTKTPVDQLDVEAETYIDPTWNCESRIDWNSSRPKLIEK